MLKNDPPHVEMTKADYDQAKPVFWLVLAALVSTNKGTVLSAAHTADGILEAFESRFFPPTAKKGSK